MKVANPMAGDRVPDVAFRLLNGNIASPADFRGQKLVLFFCNATDPAVCSRRLLDFADHAADFAQTGAWIIGLISGPDHRMLPLQPPRISVALDQQGMVGQAFGLGPAPAGATFLIDRDGTIDRTWRQPINARDVLVAARELT